MKLATYAAAGQDRIGVVDAEAARVFDLAAAASRAGADAAPFASMLALIDADDVGLDAARALLASHGAQADLWSDLAAVTLRSPLPEPRQMRDAMSFALHIRQSGRGARAVQALGAKGQEGFAAVMAEPLEPLASVYREMPIYYITNRFTVEGPESTVQWPRYSQVMDYELEIAIVTKRSRSDIPASEAGAHIFGYTIFNDFSARTGRPWRCRVAWVPPRARVSMAPTCWGHGSSRPTKWAIPRRWPSRCASTANRAPRATRAACFSRFPNCWPMSRRTRRSARARCSARAPWQLLRAGDRPFS